MTKLILSSEEAGTHRGHPSCHVVRMISLGKGASGLLSLQFSCLDFLSSEIMAVSHHARLRRNLESYSAESLTFWGSGGHSGLFMLWEEFVTHKAGKVLKISNMIV